MMNDSGLRKKERKGGSAPAWMVTFGDMMSLMLCFFILLLSFSNMDRPSFEKVSGSMREAFGAQREIISFEPPIGEQVIAPQPEPVISGLRQQMTEAFKEQIGTGQITVEGRGDQVTVRMRDSLAFDSGRAEIKDGFTPLLDKLAAALAQNEMVLLVGGHTDNVPLRADAAYSSNWSLSAARAVAVVEFLASRHQLPAHRLSAVGYADGEPVASNASEEGRAQNRRVEFRITTRQGAQNR
ncbi:MAG TPA: flagellar motor protein MotB [Desulfurivibrionaceae bacterium]|nr:flagellar motor protein MotB [Desulfurivibrionaceae bacterium]